MNLGLCWQGSLLGQFIDFDFKIITYAHTLKMSTTIIQFQVFGQTMGHKFVVESCYRHPWQIQYCRLDGVPSYFFANWRGHRNKVYRVPLWQAWKYQFPWDSTQGNFRGHTRFLKVRFHKHVRRWAMLFSGKVGGLLCFSVEIRAGVKKKSKDYGYNQ